MRRIFLTALLCLFIASTSAMSQSVRSVRQVSPRGDQPQGKIIQQHQSINEDVDTLRYEDPEWTLNYLTLPDDAMDHYYNVWFTPLYAPFQLIEVHIPLYDLEGENGTPGLRVVIFESIELFDVPGYPGQPIDSVDIAYEDLEFGAEELIWNVIDLSQLNIQFNDVVDFHVAVDVIFSDTTRTDTLGIYMDDGQYTPEGTRSGMYDGINNEWSKLTEIEDVEAPYNFAIHAVISGIEGTIDVLEPSNGLPTAVLLNPAYPNPFNSTTTVEFRIMNGLPYTATLLDMSGREVQVLGSGIGGESQRLTIDGTMLCSGSYFINVNTPSGSKMIPLRYIR